MKSCLEAHSSEALKDVLDAILQDNHRSLQKMQSKLDKVVANKDSS